MNENSRILDTSCSVFSKIKMWCGSLVSQPCRDLKLESWVAQSGTLASVPSCP